MEQSTRIYEKTNVLNTFKHNLEKKYFGNLVGSCEIDRVIIGAALYSLPINLYVYLLIYLFICILICFISLSLSLSLSLTFLAFFKLLFDLFTISFTFSHNLLYIIHVFIWLFHYIPNLLLLISQYHYLFSIYLFLHVN